MCVYIVFASNGTGKRIFLVRWPCRPLADALSVVLDVVQSAQAKERWWQTYKRMAVCTFVNWAVRFSCQTRRQGSRRSICNSNGMLIKESDGLYALQHVILSEISCTCTCAAAFEST